MQLNGSFDVKLGKSFLDKDSTSYMTMRCDFMPASVDRSQPGSIKVNEGKEVVVSLPNIANVGSECTVFRGSARPVQKECILIYNRKTQELTLERIAHTVQLKKTREERKPDSVNLIPNLNSDNNNNNINNNNNNNNQTQTLQNTQSDNHANVKTLCQSPTKWKSTELEQTSNHAPNQSIQPVQKKVKHSRTRISSSSSSDSDADDSSSSSSDSNSTNNNTTSSSSSSDTSIDMDVVSSDSDNHSGSDSDSNSSSLSSLSSGGKKLSKKPSSNTKPSNKKPCNMTVGNNSTTNTANTNNNSNIHTNSNSSIHGSNNSANHNNLAAHRKLIEHDLKLSDSDSDDSI